MSKYLILLVVILVLLGCTAATGPIFQKHSEVSVEETIIYVYRPLGFDGATLCFNIIVNNEKVGCLGTSGYISARIDPGVNEVELKGGAVNLKFSKTFHPGKAYYFEYQFKSGAQVEDSLASHRVSAFGGASHVVIRVPESEALEKLATLRLSR